MHTFKTNKQNEYVAYLFQLNTIISAKARFGKSVKEHLSWGCLTIFGGEKGCLLRFIQLVLTLEELFLRISTNYLDTLGFVKGVRGEYLETKLLLSLWTLYSAAPSSQIPPLLPTLDPIGPSLTPSPSS